MQFLGLSAPSSPGCSDAVSAGQQKLARGGMGKEFRRTASRQDWHVFYSPRFYFQCEGHEPTLLLIKTTQKEVSRDQREPGVLASEFWGL